MRQNNKLKIPNFRLRVSQMWRNVKVKRVKIVIVRKCRRNVRKILVGKYINHIKHESQGLYKTIKNIKQQSKTKTSILNSTEALTTE